MDRPYDERDFTVGNILGESFSLYRRFFTRFVGLALLVFLVVDAISAAGAGVNGTAARAVLFFLTVVVGITGFCWLQAALVLLVDDVRDGQVDTTIAQLFHRTRDRILYLLAAGALVGVAIASQGALLILAANAAGVVWLGIFAAIGLGLFLWTRWSVTAPVVVLERVGIVDGMRRSYALIRGHSWRAFWIIVIMGLIAGLTDEIIGAVLSSVLSGSLRFWLASAVANGLTAPLLAVSSTLTYLFLRGHSSTSISTQTAIPAGAAYRDE